MKDSIIISWGAEEHILINQSPFEVHIPNNEVIYLHDVQKSMFYSSKILTNLLVHLRWK